MVCPNCGTNLPDGIKFCTVCGTTLPTSYSSNPQSTTLPTTPTPIVPQSPMMNTQINPNQLPAQYRPLSAWAYFGYSILYSIPLIGFILLIIFSFSNENINRRNHARSYFCVWVLVLIISIVAGIIMAIAGFDFDDLYYMF